MPHARLLFLATHAGVASVCLTDMLVCWSVHLYDVCLLDLEMEESLNFGLGVQFVCLTHKHKC